MRKDQSDAWWSFQFFVILFTLTSLGGERKGEWQAMRESRALSLRVRVKEGMIEECRGNIYEK